MRKWLLIVLTVLAVFLRVYNLSSYPSGFTPDEASFAYDAFSILKTGKDQWGKPYPLLLESFGDYKSPLLAYLTIPFVYFYGLTKEAARLPNALLSILSLVVVYFLAGEIARLGGMRKQTVKLYQLISFIFLAFSPWHIMLSRGAFEANLTTFFLPAGILFFLKGLENEKFLNLSSLFFSLNLFTYHSAKIVTPLIVFFLIILFYKDLKSISFKYYLLAILILGAGLILTIHTFFQGGATRAKDISIVNGAINEAASERLLSINAGVPFFLAKLTNNKFTVILRRFFDNYTQYFSFQFLFSDGPSETTYGMIPGRGVLYYFEIILLFFSLYSLFIFKDKKPIYLLFFWLFISPIPAASTMGKGFAANRSAIMMPAIQMISSIGFITLFDFVKSNYPKLKNVFSAFFFSIFLVSFVSFLKDYFLISPFIASEGMLYGNLEAAYLLKSKFASEKKIVVSKRLSEPHIYIAFAEKIDPNFYQKNSQRWNYQEQGVLWVDQMPDYELGRYVFKNIDWNSDSGSNNLLVGKPDEFPSSIEPLVKINYPNSKPAIFIVKPNIQKYAKK